MPTIQSKKEIKKILSDLFDSEELEQKLLLERIQSRLLSDKVKFPLLELAGKELHSKIPEEHQIDFADQIIEYQSMGGNVVAAMILQLRLEKHFEQSFEKMIEYMISGNQWFVCDIIGERVLGHSLLKNPEITLPVLKNFINHTNSWVVRSVGVATHYAVKKGLGKKYVEETFLLLLTKSNTKDFHTKKGIGWAVKTVSKFHPDIVQKFEIRLNEDDVQSYFRTKIKIGLDRSPKYASKYSD
ncbi:DNA alkylation repair protein [Leptospira sp. 201903070]|uniref:DNA alkylation repair protein n=1 Tax=Leptospira ainlahdjerensis TaxID=2810033 RepID=A0ABS2UE09_9LEPT|nr:DNA alkylation repair protein [Leptospira ainlahdjerensis]MBM9577778.1 DNA alkylation repair protein [Leptospira ainlahdjerensis]